MQCFVMISQLRYVASLEWHRGFLEGICRVGVQNRGFSGTSAVMVNSIAEVVWFFENLFTVLILPLLLTLNFYIWKQNTWNTVIILGLFPKWLRIHRNGHISTFVYFCAADAQFIIMVSVLGKIWAVTKKYYLNCVSLHSMKSLWLFKEQRLMMQCDWKLFFSLENKHTAPSERVNRPLIYDWMKIHLWFRNSADERILWQARIWTVL